MVSWPALAGGLGPLTEGFVGLGLGLGGPS